LNRSQPANAVELLQSAISYEGGTPNEGGSEFLLGAGNLDAAYVRGLAYLAAHQGREAAREFQKILNHRGIVVCDPIGALAHLQLGRAYALAGDKTKARSAYQDFLTLWKDADPDIPILKQAQAESQLRLCAALTGPSHVTTKNPDIACSRFRQWHLESIVSPCLIRS
jgi:tetratricopeptide (TPR) repeat protein